MKHLLRIRSSYHILNRFKSKFSNASQNKKTIERLDYESKLLFGDAIEATKRKRSRKKSDLQASATESAPEETIFYQFKENGDNNDVENSIDIGNLVQPLAPAPDSIQSNVTEENGSSIFPLYNSEKPEYSNDASAIKAKRVYAAYPSITTILSETVSEFAKRPLEQWKENMISEMGQDGFDEYQKNQLEFRNIFLNLIHKRLLGTPENELNVNAELEGCWKSLQGVFPLLSELKIMKSMVVHHELKFKGMIDSIIMFRNKPVLVNWKKSSKIKSSIDMTYDAPLQIAAYIGALNHDQSYPYKIEESLLIVSYDDGSKADVFHLEKENCLKYWRMFLERLRSYQNLKTESSKLSEEKIETKDELVNHTESSSDTNTKPKATSRKTKKNASSEPKLVFPLCNESKPLYSSQTQYDMNPVKLPAYSSYPSVTTVLSESKSESSKFLLKRWKDGLIAELGEEGFELYHKNLLETGTTLHNLIQQRLSGVPETELDITAELDGCWKSLQPVFPLFSEIKIMEKYVAHQELKYKGIIDCIAEFRGKPMLIDWKKSDKVKSTLEATYDAPLQVAAYVGATNYDDSYPFKIEEGLLVYCYVDGTKADIFHLNKGTCEYYWNSWLQRLQKYRTELKANDLKIEY